MLFSCKVKHKITYYKYITSILRQNINYKEGLSFYSTIILPTTGFIEERMPILLTSLIEPWSITFTLGGASS
jgi:hypothetical protein